MKLVFRRFREKNFQAYGSWFLDPELDRRLGPIDREWLGAALLRKDRATWAVFRDEVLVTVVETVFDPENKLAAVSALAVKPDLRGQGVGTAVLKQLLATHRKGVRRHVAYVKVDNRAARRCLEHVGFVLSAEPNAYGYLEFRHGDA